ncbi:MAG: HAMP domain-containing sensor histidine kinase [Candidatus Binatus sp.]|uniref:sensor histidine kinase n=1 Tax=Candidatus Binatus sp. TaxID=2811406 RepID=UPI0027185D4E|nr:HAMP domain-containing sensor histidine kinase [Candidatus Binatus sp.]MDO8435014.1 HAMP domain-containing sensor histidine kinase [Candidatus Binatus sp.]
MSNFVNVPESDDARCYSGLQPSFELNPPHPWDHGLRLEALANLAHELRSPMQVLLGYLDIICDELADSLDERQKHIFERMNVNALDLAQTVENVMEFAADEHTERWTNEEIRIRELVAELTPALDAANSDKGLKVIFDLERSPTVFRSSRHAIKAILMNLALNGIKFTARGTVTISISCGTSGEHEPILEIRVSDTGPGMDAASIAQAFDVCSQLSNTSERAHRGMGLGLAVVRRNAIALNGTVRVHSVLREGSTFLVTIPLQGQSPRCPIRAL